MIAILSHISPRLAMLFAGLAIMGISLFKPAPAEHSTALGPVVAPATPAFSLETRVSALETKVAGLHGGGDWTRFGTLIGAAVAGFSGVIRSPRRCVHPRSTARRRSR
jgi:hypothetical protein